MQYDRWELPQRVGDSFYQSFWLAEKTEKRKPNSIFFRPLSFMSPSRGAFSCADDGNGTMCALHSHQLR